MAPVLPLFDNLALPPIPLNPVSTTPASSKGKAKAVDGTGPSAARKMFKLKVSRDQYRRILEADQGARDDPMGMRIEFGPDGQGVRPLPRELLSADLTLF